MSSPIAMASWPRDGAIIHELEKMSGRRRQSEDSVYVATRKPSTMLSEGLTMRLLWGL